MARENTVKAKIRAWLNGFGPAVAYITPVPGPFGKTKGDFVFSFCGLFCAIEAKAPKKKATKLQALKHEELRASGALVFVVDNPKEQLPLIERVLKRRADLYRSAVHNGACDVQPHQPG